MHHMLNIQKQIKIAINATDKKFTNYFQYVCVWVCVYSKIHTYLLLIS